MTRLEAPITEITLDGKGLGRLRNSGRRIGVGLAGATLATAALGVPVMASDGQRPSAIVIEGNMPSYSPTLVFDGKVARFETQAASVNPEKITSPQQAASMFGVDAYSKNPKSWIINQYGGAELIPNSGRVHRVKTNGAVVEGWIKIRKAGRDAETLVANPLDTSILDITAGTFWKAPQGQERALWAQVRKQVIANEAKTQPDVSVLPICLPSKDNRAVTPVKISSKQQAATLYGGDSYSKNPQNWIINQYGGAELIPSGTAHRVKLNGAVLEGWVKVTRQGIDAMTFVAIQVNHIDINGGTVWKPKSGDANALFYQLLAQVKAKEAVQQPGVGVYPVCN